MHAQVWLRITAPAQALDIQCASWTSSNSVPWELIQPVECWDPLKTYWIWIGNLARFSGDLHANNICEALSRQIVPWRAWSQGQAMTPFTSDIKSLKHPEGLLLSTALCTCVILLWTGILQTWTVLRFLTKQAQLLATNIEGGATLNNYFSSNQQIVIKIVWQEISPFFKYPYN